MSQLILHDAPPERPLNPDAAALASATAALERVLRARLSAATRLRRAEPLAGHTTLRVGGPADLYVEPASEADLALLVRACAEHAVPMLVLGRGSNLLVRDGGIRGVVLALTAPAFGGLEVRGDRLVSGAGVRLKALAQAAKAHGLAGLEFLEGIPGTVGGAVRMNAGALGAWTFERLEWVRFMDRSGEVAERPAATFGAEYRGCAFFRDHVALAAGFRGRPDDPAAIHARMQAGSRRRWASQPNAPSAGCIFKNPAALPAGKLIEELGLKGRRVGGARVSEVHANFIVTEPGATAADVLELMREIREQARARRALELQPEVQIVGVDTP